MEFQNRLNELRRKAGMSQEELAGVVGVTRQAVQKWESGASRPDMENLTTLARYFGVTLDWLITGEEPPAAEPAGQTVIEKHYYHRWAYEYKSQRTLWGLPLVHVHVGYGFCWAKGIVAIGNQAVGLVSLGGFALGLLSSGGLSLGLLLSLGGFAVGALSLGGVAVGLAAWGGVALGVVAVGGVACGSYALGGAAMASKVAVGGAASAPVAVGSAAEGAQAFVIPAGGLEGERLTAALEAVEAACKGAPSWLRKMLSFAVRHT